MKFTGIWIDKREAKIVCLTNNLEQLQVVDSNIETYNIKGGSGAKFKGGPQDVIQDSKYLEREKHQIKSFFEKIVHLIQDVDAIVIFGPAQMGNRFNKELSENSRKLFDKVKGIEKADSMTNSQIIAWVRGYFKINS